MQANDGGQEQRTTLGPQSRVTLGLVVGLCSVLASVVVCAVSVALYVGGLRSDIMDEARQEFVSYRVSETITRAADSTTRTELQSIDARLAKIERWIEKIPTVEARLDALLRENGK